VDQTLLDLLDLPDPPVVVYERSPLVLTICEITFTAVLSVADQGFVGPFQRAIQTDYPFPKRLEQIALGIDFGAGQAAMQGSQQPSLRWEFQDRQGMWTVVLTSESLSLQTRRYEHFADFIERFQKLLDALVVHIGPEVGTKLGLRYINEIPIGDTRELTAIRPELLGPLVLPGFNRYAELALQQIFLRDDNQPGLNINHGLVTSGSAVQPPSNHRPLDQPFYLLDFDAFQEFPVPASRGLPLDAHALCERVNTLNKVIYRLFRWSVSDTYLASLGVHRGRE